MRISLLLVALGVVANGANAEGGIDFAAMPKGCSWQTKLSNAPLQTQTFVGRVKGKYRIETTNANSGEAVNYTEYNKKGLMTARIWADGRWERFEPFSCFTVPGNCSYTYKNGNGDHLTIDSTVTANSKGYTSAAQPREGSPYPTESFSLGPFGLMTTSRSENYSSKIVRFTNCGPNA